MTTTGDRPQQVDPRDPGSYSGGEMSLVEHLGELRTRLIRALIGVVVGMVLSFFVVDDVFRALSDLATRSGASVQVIAPLERFSNYFKISFMCGLALSMPVVVYQLIAFVSPGLTRKERNYVLRALPFMSVLFIAGAAFAYFVVLRSSLAVLLNIGGEQFENNLRLTDYISFVTNLVLWVGVSFQMPVIVYTLIKLGLVSAQRLASWRKYVLLIIVVAAAIITPTPDPLNLGLVAVPMYLLFELGILMGRLGTRGR